MKTYKVWAKSVTYLYTYVDAKDYETAWDIAHDLDGSTFIDKNDGDWDIYSVEEVTNV